jgi:hypothetical protein
LIASAEKAPGAAVPDSEREVSNEVLETVGPPHRICVQDELGIGGLASMRSSMTRKVEDQFRAPIHAAVGCDPKLITLQLAGLMLPRRGHRSSQKRVTESYMLLNPYILRVWPARTQRAGQPPEKIRIDGSSVEVQHAYESAHSVLLVG